MLFKQIHIGGDKNLAYLVGDEQSGQVAAVDPSGNPHRLLEEAEALGASIITIVVTHSHFDHIAGVDEFKRATGAPFAAYKSVPGVDVALDDGDRLEVGAVKIEVTFCPGHCHDSILLLGDAGKLIVGDELFIGGVGITRSEAQARRHYENLHQKLLQFDDAVEVYPGHDYGAKAFSTIGEQRRTNPYLLQKDFDAFWHLRRNWKQYCREHGIDWG